MYKSNVNIRVCFFNTITKKPLFLEDITKTSRTLEEWDELNRNKSIENNSIFDGYEELNLKDDFSKIYLYQTSNVISLRGKKFNVIEREFKADFPLMLNMYVEQID